MYNNDSVRKKLIEINMQGLLLKAISVNVGISESDLSRFKSGVNCLKESDVKILYSYLNKVVIPQWRTKRTERDSNSKEFGKIEKVSSLDILNEFV